MKKIMLGNEAIARGAYEAGCAVASSYPGTPSTEITEYISEYDEIYSEWAPNEKVAMEVAIGASIGGARSICAQKHVGLNVAADPMFTVSYAGVNGGLVIVTADDPGMHSSQNEQDSRHYARAAKIPMLEPADSQECKDYVKKAFEISERFDTPVLVRLSTRVAHSRSVVEPGERLSPVLKEYKKDPAKYIMMPANAVKRHAAEIIELKDKPSVPCGEIGRDAFGGSPQFTDRGIIKRAILACGRQDVLWDHIVPLDGGIELIGASSDHLILDLTNADKSYDVGDTIDFSLDYGALLSVCTSEYVSKVVC